MDSKKKGEEKVMLVQAVNENNGFNPGKKASSLVNGVSAGTNQNVRTNAVNIEMLKNTTPCFGCGQFGHWKNQCPLLSQNANQSPVVNFQTMMGQPLANFVTQQQSIQQPIQPIQQQPQQFVCGNNKNQQLQNALETQNMQQFQFG